MSNVKTFNLELKASQTHGQRADETFAQLSYRSRQNPKQSCYIPDDAVTEHGVYHTILGPLHMAEAIPAEHKECRLVQGAAATGSPSLTRRNATLRPQAVMA